MNRGNKIDKINLSNNKKNLSIINYLRGELLNIKEVILNAKRFNASDIHIICNDYITLRIDGELTRYSSKVVNSDICRKFCDDLIGSEETKLRNRYEKYIDEECGEVDFSRDFDL